MKCIVCGRSLSNTETEVHHISYPVNGFPEVTVEVHKRCHNIIHNTDVYPGLKPRKGHSAQYYSQKSSKEREEPKVERKSNRGRPKKYEEGQVRHSVSWGKKEDEVWEDVTSLAKIEQTSVSRIVLRALKEYTKRHLLKEGEKSDYSKVLDIIEEADFGISYKEIVERATKEGIDEDFVQDVLEKEKKRGGLYEPKKGRYAIAP